MPNFEKPDGVQEEIPRYHTKVEVVQRLKEKGFSDPDTQKMVQSWVNQREKEATMEGTARANIILNIDRIDLYEAAGMSVDDVWADVVETFENARREGQEDLVDQLLTRFPELEGD